MVVDSSRASKLEINSRASKSEFDSQTQSDRSHLVMQNLAKALWNILKQYNGKLKVMIMSKKGLSKLAIKPEKTLHQIDSALPGLKLLAFFLKFLDCSIP